MLTKGPGGKLVFSFLALWRLAEASSNCGTQSNNTGDNARRDDDSDGGDSSSSPSHRPHSTSSCLPSATNSALPQSDAVHGGVRKGTVAGVVVGVVVGVLVLFAVGLCCWMRYRRRRTLEQDAEALAVAHTNQRESTSEVRLLSDTHPPPPTSSLVPTHTLPPLYSSTIPTGEIAHAPRAMTTGIDTSRDLARSASLSSLPNPHEPGYNPSGVLSLSHGEYAERDLPPLPDSLLSPRNPPPAATPSFFPSDLSRGLTHASRLTRGTTDTRMSLHDEMAIYQKRLEVHHEKEMNTQDAGGSGEPADPPPEYREAD